MLGVFDRANPCVDPNVIGNFRVASFRGTSHSYRGDHGFQLRQ